MWTTLIFLTISNVFMTFAWYYHLKHPALKAGPLWLAIAASWGIAFFEYCFQVPANRAGHAAGLSVSQLKIVQEAITLGVFLVFVAVVFGERLQWNHYAGFGMVLGGVALVFGFWQAPKGERPLPGRPVAVVEAGGPVGRVADEINSAGPSSDAVAANRPANHTQRPADSP